MGPNTSSDEKSCLDSFCLPYLLEAQNADGGWGFQPAARSATEPTCWSLLALSGVPQSEPTQDAVKRGLEWAIATQLDDGSWPAFQGQPEGCWVTSLACLTLFLSQGPSQALERALIRLCRDWPGEGGWWWRLREKLTPDWSVVKQNSALRGWSWTPGTSSWVEPTSYALIALCVIPEDLHPRGARRRRRLAESMLYDRMCPAGGWNCGNPVVYGVAGEPAVGPTAWALLALKEHAHETANQRSLEWLAGVLPTIQAPGSLVLAHLCLRSYQRPSASLAPILQSVYDRNQFLHNVMVVAWFTLAFGSAPWLEMKPLPEGSRER